MKSSKTTLSLTVNGSPVTDEVEPRLLLSDFLRHQLGLTGTHVGCEQGVCGACTVLIDGEPARSCLTFACQAEDTAVETVEGLASEGGLNVLQRSFQENHGLQCGFCTPGFLMAATALLNRNDDPSDDEIREELSGNICRCTGYENIVRSVRAAAEQIREPRRTQAR
jgi:aerobic carbon-monoxide dehydrogenase small subunit